MTYQDPWDLPEDTNPVGVRCGNHPRDLRIYHASADEVHRCHVITAEWEAEQAAEIYAEAGMSWVAGGGSPEDARIYASVIASGRDWNEYLTGQPA